ncbi:MAG: hypothetical protein IPK12_23670 [Gemmatimonadetes bacterium]|nr:hypothetical protein [Gemmatimonadota bacterium]
MTAKECAAFLRVSLSWLAGSDVPWVPLPTKTSPGAEPRVMRRYLPAEVEAWAKAKRYELLGVGQPGQKVG